MTMRSYSILVLAATSLLIACSSAETAEAPERSTAASLTGQSYKGAKYYLGWGHAGQGDPEEMHNEVKYDVLHTHQIFTSQLGGGYRGSPLVDNVGGTTEAVEQAFNAIKGGVGPQDMFVQYSSGHGFEEGLQIGGSYEEIASRVLTLPAREIIVFTMACHSGGLVDTFNSKRSQWQNFAQQGRTLFVMSSSTVEQQSSTGPREQDAGPTGSSGSAFGHSLWKALSGEADGFVDGVKDGFIDLGEIDGYVKMRTQQIGGHNPVSTGAYNPMLIMDKVAAPGNPALTNNNRGTAAWSDAQLKAMIQATDQAWSNQQIAKPDF